MLHKIIIITGIVVSACFSSTNFTPPQNDTMILSYDPLQIGTFGSRVSFFCSRTAYIHKDSVTWYIDDSLPRTGEAVMYGGSNDRTHPMEYSTGAGLGISWPVSPRFGQGIHKVQMIARFEDSTISGTWYFRYSETVYKQIRAELAVDTAWQAYSNLTGWKTYTSYHIISAAPFDTAIFGNASRPLDSLIRYDTDGCLKKFIRCRSGYVDLPLKDTVDVSVIQILRGDSTLSEWLISQPLDSLLVMTSAPFPLKTAIDEFNRYVTEKNIRTGYAQPPGDLRLGPVFTTVAGDPGWSLAARHDTSCWYFTLNTGTGDCPCGCIFWTSRVYEVSENGVVPLENGIVQRTAASRVQNQHPEVRYPGKWVTLKGQAVSRSSTRPSSMATGILFRSPASGVVKKTVVIR